MQLIVITPEITIKNEILLVTDLFEKGLERLHLRKHNATISEYRNYLRQIPFPFHAFISIHQYPELLKEFPGVGFHCKASVIKDEAVMQTIFTYNHSNISASFHSWEEMKEIAYPFKYVFISPVFNSISKHGYKGCINIENVKQVKAGILQQKKVCPDIIALGGIAKSNIVEVYNAGFDGAAMLGSIWQAQQPVSEFVRLKDYIKQVKQ